MEIDLQGYVIIHQPNEVKGSAAASALLLAKSCEVFETSLLCRGDAGSQPLPSASLLYSGDKTAIHRKICLQS